MCMPDILPNSFFVQRRVPVHGINQLGLRSHPNGWVTHEALTMTFSFVRSDKPVYTTMSIRPFSPCHPTRAMAGPMVSHVRNPYPTFPAGIRDFHGRLYSELGRPHARFLDFRYLDPFRMQAQIFWSSRR